MFKWILEYNLETFKIPEILFSSQLMAMGGVALNLWALPLMSLSQGCRRLFEPSPPVYEKGINYLHLRNQVPLPAGSAQPSPAQPARHSSASSYHEGAPSP